MTFWSDINYLNVSGYRNTFYYNYYASDSFSLILTRLQKAIISTSKFIKCKFVDMARKPKKKSMKIRQDEPGKLEK